MVLIFIFVLAESLLLLGLFSSCGGRASHRRGFSSDGARALERRLSSCGSWA